MANVKVLIGEIDSQELAGPEERLLDSIDCAFSHEDFNAGNAKDAIVEASRPLIPIFVLGHNSNLSNGDWINFSSLTPDAKIVMPFDLTIKKLTWANRRSGIDCDWKIYKNGISESDVCQVLEFRNTPNDYGTFDCDVDFSEGDWIRIMYVDQGTNMSDLNAIMWGERR